MAWLLQHLNQQLQEKNTHKERTNFCPLFHFLCLIFTHHYHFCPHRCSCCLSLRSRRLVLLYLYSNHWNCGQEFLEIVRTVVFIVGHNWMSEVESLIWNLWGREAEDISIRTVSVEIFTRLNSIIPRSQLKWSNFGCTSYSLNIFRDVKTWRREDSVFKTTIN